MPKYLENRTVLIFYCLQLLLTTTNIKPNNMSKNTTIIARITELDKIEFMQNCTRKGLKPSEVIRNFILDLNEKERDGII